MQKLQTVRTCDLVKELDSSMSKKDVLKHIQSNYDCSDVTMRLNTRDDWYKYPTVIITYKDVGYFYLYKKINYGWRSEAYQQVKTLENMQKHEERAKARNYLDKHFYSDGKIRSERIQAHAKKRYQELCEEENRLDQEIERIKKRKNELCGTRYKYYTMAHPY